MLKKVQDYGYNKTDLWKAIFAMRHHYSPSAAPFSLCRFLQGLLSQAALLSLHTEGSPRLRGCL